MTSVVWFRRDARLDDNPALTAATEDGAVCALFVIDPALFSNCSQRRRDLLVAGLADLDSRLADRGGRLRVEYGDPAKVVPVVADDVGAGVVHINSEVTPYGVRRDRRVASEVELVPHEGIYVLPPGSVLTNQGDQYKVFSRFFEKWSELDPRPVTLPERIELLDDSGAGLPQGDEPVVEAGPSAASARLERFIERVDDYLEERDRIDLSSTSHLSVDLKYGWIGPRQVVSRVGRSTESRKGFIRQIAWRDFYGHLLAAFPELVTESFDERFRGVRWRNDPDEIAAWKEGRTGFPLVDAAMRQLVADGEMHNRARMIVASFLVKDLLVDWRVGERFFRHHLIDGDVAQNVGNWQWVAGTGTDAAPYFRAFNPVSQSEKFDPSGTYIRRWVPELAEVPDNLIHAPWELGPLELTFYSVGLGATYPEPLVDHFMARERAIAAYRDARTSR